jgi:ATP-dependent DNA ligase
MSPSRDSHFWLLSPMFPRHVLVQFASPDRSRRFHRADKPPLVVEAVNHLKVRSCLIDGEVVRCDEHGLAVFDILRRRQNEASAFLYAFDLLEIDGTDMRREPIEVRKATLATSCARAARGCA